MLVLNTNEWWVAPYLIANKSLFSWFPDFSRNIFLTYSAIFATTQQSSVQTIANLWSVETINWTPINFYCEEVAEPYNFTWMNWSSDGSNDRNNFWWSSSFPIPTSYSLRATFRIWTRYWIDGWIHVWKNIIWKLSRLYFEAASNYKISWYVTAKPWLLHSDWTIEYFWTMTRDDGVAHASNQTITLPPNKIFQNIIWSWLVTQEGDRFIVDYSVYVKCSQNLTWNAYYMGVFRPRLYSVRNNNFDWIQISID